MALNNVEIGLQSGQEILAKWLNKFELRFWSYFWYMRPKNFENITLHFYCTSGFVYKTIFHFPILISGLHRQQASGAYTREIAQSECLLFFFVMHSNADRFKRVKLVIGVSINWFKTDWWVNIFTLAFSSQPNCAFTDRFVAQLCVHDAINHIYSTISAFRMLALYALVLCCLYHPTQHETALF